MTSASEACPRCGRPLRRGTVEGLCPRCLMRRAADWLVLDPPGRESEALEESPEPGRRFGEFQLLEEVARGGMGVVYRARQPALNREVALKLLLAGEWASPEFVERFRTEARAAAMLDHPHIVPVHAFGETEGRWYLAMRFVAGESLARHLARTGVRPPWPEAARLMARLARAVHYAHQRGVLHRDLKPGNVLLGPDQQPFLTDFGLARLVAEDSDLTHTLAVLGTPGYLAPEQASPRGRPITTSTDVYGLGAILYELLCGRPPFAGGTALETLRQVVDREPDRPSAVARDVDPELEIICLKCLEKEPERRYGSAEALADDLERRLRHEPILARPATPPERLFKWIRRRPRAASFLAVMILGVLAVTVASVLVSRRLSTLAEGQRQQLVKFNVDEGHRRVDHGDPVTAMLYFVQALRLDADRPDRVLAHRRRMALLQPHLPSLEQFWVHDAPVNAAVFSGDGRRVVSASDDRTARIWEVVAGGPAAVTLHHPVTVAYACFSPDDRLVATTDDAGTGRIWDAQTGQLLVENLRVSASGSRRPFAPAVRFTRDGRIITRFEGVVRVVEARSGRASLPDLNHPGAVLDFWLLPDGRTLLTAATDGWIREWNLENADPQPRLRVRPDTVLDGASFSADGTLAMTVSPDWSLRIWDLLMDEPRTLPMRHGTGMRVHQTALSPNGALAVSASYDNTVFTWDSRNGRRTQDSIRHDGGIQSAAFDVTGRRVVTAGFDGTARVWDAEHGQAIGPLLNHGGYVFMATFDATGERVLTASQDWGVRVWKLPHARARLTLDHDAPVTTALFNRDSSLLATATSDGRMRLHDGTTGAPRGEPLEHPAAPSMATFSPDGSRLLVATVEPAAHLWDPHLGRAVAPPLQVGQRVRSLAISPDGKLAALGTASWVAGQPSEVHLVDTAALRPVRAPWAITGSVMHVTFSPDSRWLMACLNSGHARLLEVASGQASAAVFAGEGAMVKGYFSPDGARVAVAYSAPGYRPSYARLWDFASRQALGPLMHHQDAVVNVIYSPDGRYVATASEDSTARLWEAATGGPVSPALPMGIKVEWLAFSRDSRILATGATNGRLRLWDVPSGEPLTGMIEAGGFVVATAFASNQRDWLVGGSAGRVSVWSLDPLPGSPLEIQRATTRLSARLLDSSGGVQVLLPQLVPVTALNTGSVLRAPVR